MAGKEFLPAPLSECEGVVADMHGQQMDGLLSGMVGWKSKPGHF